MSHRTENTAVRDQFNRCAQYYLKNSAMADQELLRLIVRLANPRPNDQVLDVACGAGFLVDEFARCIRKATGLDLSEKMLIEARRYALQLGLANTSFQLGNAEALPFSGNVFDIVSCKLALHYFPDPRRAIGEMKRVTRSGARVILVDRVASEDREQQEYLNRLERLRTPSKVRVYSTLEIVRLMELHKLSIVHLQHYEQEQDFDEWNESTGASEANQRRVRALMWASLHRDLTGLKLRMEGGKLKMTHNTAIVVAKLGA